MSQKLDLLGAEDTLVEVERYASLQQTLELLLASHRAAVGLYHG